MPDVEQGNPILIGATTMNPCFVLLPALLSRSLVCEFKPLDPAAIHTLLVRALEDTERGLGAMRIQAEPAALEHLAEVCDGDARRALTALEVAALTTPPGPDGVMHLTMAVVEESIQKKAVVYDQAGDAHYDTASAFIKSMRGSDPHATLYWLAKMLYAGEDPRFIARRLVICAAEDVGNADPQALVLATAAMHVSEFVGMPECRIPLAQAAVYVACAPKSNAAYLGIEKAMQDVEAGRTLEVPSHLKDAHYAGAEALGHGAGYQYPHDAPTHHVEQAYLPHRRVYYEPTDSGFEKTMQARLAHLIPPPFAATGGGPAQRAGAFGSAKGEGMTPPPPIIGVLILAILVIVYRFYCVCTLTRIVTYDIVVIPPLAAVAEGNAACRAGPFGPAVGGGIVAHTCGHRSRRGYDYDPITSASLPAAGRRTDPSGELPILASSTTRCATPLSAGRRGDGMIPHLSAHSFYIEYGTGAG